MYKHIIYGGWKPSEDLVSPEYQEQLDVLADTLAVSGLNKICLENAIYKAVDHGDMTPEYAQQTLDDYGDTFGGV